MLGSGEGKENEDKTAHFFCTFLCRCFVRQHKTS